MLTPAAITRVAVSTAMVVVDLSVCQPFVEALVIDKNIILLGAIIVVRVHMLATTITATLASMATAALATAKGSRGGI